MKSRGSTLRGGRLGGASSAEVDRGAPVEPRRTVSYWCSSGHESQPRFATSAVAPESWLCDRCGLPAGQDATAPPSAPPLPGTAPKTPWGYLLMRRSLSDGEKLLDEALASLHANRGTRTR